MQTIKVKQNQTLMDVALQEYGDVFGVFWLVEDNQLNGITANIHQGEELLIREQKMNKRMVDYLRPHEIATGEGVQGTGIGYMKIGTDFKIA